MGVYGMVIVSNLRGQTVTMTIETYAHYLDTYGPMPTAWSVRKVET